MKKSKMELILEVGAAGGTISIWSVNTKDGTRSFVVTTDESTLKQFMDEEDAKGISFRSETPQLNSFTAALTALGQYPWHMLSPMFVHQDFIDPILKAVMQLGGEKEINRWRHRLACINKGNSHHDEPGKRAIKNPFGLKNINK